MGSTSELWEIGQEFDVDQELRDTFYAASSQRGPASAMNGFVIPPFGQEAKRQQDVAANRRLPASRWIVLPSVRKEEEHGQSNNTGRRNHATASVLTVW